MKIKHETVEEDKSTQRAQTSLAEAAHCLHIAQIRDLESLYGDPDCRQNLISWFLYDCRDILKI